MPGDPVQSTYVKSPDAFERARIPGSFHVKQDFAEGTRDLLYFCPCGCGIVTKLKIGIGSFPNVHGPSWKWNGSTDKAELTPEIHIVGHWRGRLVGGAWVAI